MNLIPTEGLCFLRRLGAQERRKYDGEAQTLLIAPDMGRRRGEEIKTDHWGEVVYPPKCGTIAKGEIVAFDAAFTVPADQYTIDGVKLDCVRVEHVLAVWED